MEANDSIDQLQKSNDQKQPEQYNKNPSNGLEPKKNKILRVEDTLLFKLVEEYDKNWKEIVKHMPERSEKQIRERYINKLNPNINRPSWTKEEDIKFLNKTQLFEIWYTSRPLLLKDKQRYQYLKYVKHIRYLIRQGYLQQNKQNHIIIIKNMSEYRNSKLFDGDVGYEIKGTSPPKFRRKSLGSNDDDYNIELPNGDLNLGRQYFNQSCSGCHDLDSDFLLGPALRTVYLRKNGSNKKFQLYGAYMKGRHLIWNRRKLWEFLHNPERMFPETNMSFDGINDPYILASVIDYLQYLRVFTSDNRYSKKPIF